MTARLQKWLNLKSTEVQPVIILGTYYFFLMAMAIVGRSARDAYFLARFTREDLPTVMLLIPVVSVLTSYLYTRLAKRLSLIPLALLGGAFFSSSLLLIQLLLSDYVSAFLYIWIEVINTVTFFHFWLLAGSVFDSRQAKRLFGLIGVGGALGTILIGTSMQPFVRTFGADYLLSLTAGCIIIWMLMAWLMRPYLNIKTPKKASQQATQEPGRIFDGYLRNITILMALSLIAASFIDYQFKVIAKDAFDNDPEHLAAFFGRFYAGVGLITLAIRLFFERRILGVLGILAGLLLFPLTAATGSMLVLVSPVLFSAVLLKGADQIFRYTLYDTTIELLWVPIEPARKVRAKPIVSGSIVPILISSAALVLLVGATGLNLDVRYFSALVLAMMLLWLPAIFAIQRRYVKQLLSSIETRQIEFEDLTTDISDVEFVQTIKKSLRSADEVEQAFALEMIENLKLTPWKQEIAALLKDGSYHIQQKILDIVVDDPDVVPDAVVLDMVRQVNDLTDESIVLASRRNLRELLPLLDEYLASPIPEIRAAAAKAILLWNEGSVDAAHQVFEIMLTERDSSVNALALAMLVDIPKEFPRHLMREYLQRSTTHVLNLSLKVAQQLKDVDQGQNIADVARNLRKARTAPMARRILRDYPRDEVIQVLLTIYHDDHTSEYLQQGILQALRDYPDPRVLLFLGKVLLDFDDIMLYAEAVSTLLALARQEALEPEFIRVLHAQTREVAHYVYSRNELLLLLEQADPENLLYADLLRDDIRLAKPSLLRLAIMDKPDVNIEAVIHSLEASEQTKLSNILEIMENVFSREERGLIVPLFDTLSPQERSEIGHHYYSDLPKTLVSEATRYILSHEPWHSMVALDYVIRHRLMEVINVLDWNKVIASKTNRNLVVHMIDRESGSYLRDLPDFPGKVFPVQRGNPMLSLLEKTILLKSASLFKDLPAREVSHIAQIAKEITLQSNQDLFKEGDAGDAMFVVVRGNIRVHKEETEITTFFKGDCLGELAFLDEQPRSATATALKDTTVLKITRTDFYEVMATRIEVVQGIVRLLASRLRASTRVLGKDRHDKPDSAILSGVFEKLES